MHFISHVLPAIEHIGVFGYWVILLASFLESIAFVGVFIPGSIFVIFGGFLAAQGYLNFLDLVWFVAAGAILGDGLSYYLGTRGVRFFKAENRFLKISLLERGKNFFKRHGNKSVFWGRFVGPIRPIIPFVAGLSEMGAQAFLFWNITSAFAWSIVFLSLGYFFGNALSVIQTWVSKSSLFIIGVAIVCGLLWFAVKRSRNFSKTIHSLFISFTSGLAHNSEVKGVVSKYEWLVKFLKKKFDLKKFSGLPFTTLGVAFTYILLLFVGIVQAVVTSTPIVDIDVFLVRLMLTFYDPVLLNIFIWITRLANVGVIFMALILATIIFWCVKKPIYAYSLWLTVVGSELFAFLGKILVHRMRPVGFSFYREATFSFPSFHAAVAVAFYGFLVYALLKKVTLWHYRMTIIFAGVLLVFLIGLSRMYLGVHFLSDVLGGYSMGLLWLIIGITVTEWATFKKRSAIIKK